MYENGSNWAWSLVIKILTLTNPLEGQPDVIFSEDEEYKKVSFDKFAKLKPVFQKENGMIQSILLKDFSLHSVTLFNLIS